MSPEQLKSLRAELKCTAQELAQTLGLETKEVQGWENGTEFPTKRRITQLEGLRAKGPTAIVRKPSSRAKSGVSDMERLADPDFWRLVRKLAAHPQLFAQALTLSEAFDDPAAKPAGK